jgi:hypothetical protein
LALPATGISTGQTTTRNLVIRNLGKTGNLMGNVEVSNPSPSAFTISPSALNVAPRGSQTEMVIFTPGTASLTNTATVTINSNDAKNPVFSVNLSGRGFAGRLVVPASFVIRAPTGGAAVIANLTLRNAGRGLLAVSWPTLLASPPTSPYSVTGGSMNIAPSTSITIPISFAATAKGRAPTAPFTITVSGLSTGGRTVTLRGIGQ